jgi:hypothetical protein
MPGHSNHAGKLTISAYLRASCHAAASGDRGIFANAAIMSDVHLIIDDDTIVDNRMVQCPSVDGRTGIGLASCSAVALTNVR